MLLLDVSNKENIKQEMYLIEVLRAGGSIDLLAHDAPKQDVEGGLLISCLAGIESAKLTDEEFTALLRKYGS